MIWVTLERFCKITKMSRQGIYKKVDQGKLQSKKESGRVFIGLDIDQDDIEELTSQQTELMNNQLEHAKNIFVNLSEDTKRRYDQLLAEVKNSNERIVKSKENELVILKNAGAEIMKMKDEEIDRLRLELQKKKSFWSR